LTIGDEPKVSDECHVRAMAALSAAQAIGRLRSALATSILPPAIAGEGAQLLTRLSQTLRYPSPSRLDESAADARALTHDALAAVATGSARVEQIQALNDVVVGSQTLVSELMRARIMLQENNHAFRI
jgi:hypothetical protein